MVLTEPLGASQISNQVKAIFSVLHNFSLTSDVSVTYSKLVTRNLF